MSISSQELYEHLKKIPMLDAHTHIHAGHITARGLDDILLYHMVISELYSAGCPDGARMSDDPDESERETRILRALPYIKYIQNTSCFWGVRIILADLYGWNEPITKDNWKSLDAIISEHCKNPNWAREIMKKAGIQRSITELWRGVDGRADDIFQYSVEWSFFTRSQWGQYDTALIELEHAWNEDFPGAPLPVTMDRESLSFKKTINTLDDVKTAITHYCSHMPVDKILSTASHFSTDISYRLVSEEEMSQSLKKRAAAGPEERDVYANYIHEAYLNEIIRVAPSLILQYSLGAEPLPFETGSKLRTETVFELAALFARHKSLSFNLFNANFHQQQALNTLVRELPNVSLSGYWWHNFFPAYISQTFNARLDMVPCNKNVGFFSDAYCMDWSYAKAVMIRKQMAEVLSNKIAQGQYDLDTALEIVRILVYETPMKLLGMVPNIK